MKIKVLNFNNMEVELKIKGYKCERCSHEWQPRKKEYPVTCPNCKSPYWDKPRRENKK